MDRIKKLKIKKQDGTFSDYIPIGADAENIDTTDGESVQLKLNKKPYYYDTIADMKSDTKLKDGDVAITLSYDELGDNRGGLYAISTTAFNEYTVTLNNNLIANLIIQGQRNISSEKEKYQFDLSGATLFGTGGLSYPIQAQSGTDYIIKISSWYNQIDSVWLRNSENHVSNMTGILCESGRNHTIKDVRIEDNFKIGINLKKGSYSKIINTTIDTQRATAPVGTTGISIGDPEDRTSWIGVISIIDSHIDRYDVAVRQNCGTGTPSIDTPNTLAIERCSFEADNVGVENYGKLYINNTYFGDTPTPAEGEIQNALIARGSSETYLKDCTIQIANKSASGNTVNAVISLQDGAKVEVNGGVIGISGQSNVDKPSGIYTSNSENDIIYIDNVNFIPSTQNRLHSRFPYYLYSYSPLRSHNPIKNYIVNGTLTNPIITTENISFDQYATINSDLVNPFNGAYVETEKQEGSNSQGVITFCYKIPKEFVGKPMTLEVYSYETDNYVIIESDGLTTSTLWPAAYNYTNHWKEAPSIWRTTVTPTKSQGTVTYGFRWNAHAGTKAALAGIVLKENSEELLLSCYKDANVSMCMSKPLNITDAIKGDIIYAFDPSTVGTMGWIFNGTEWITSNDLTPPSI